MPLRSIAFLIYFFGSSAMALAVPMIGVICYIVLYHVFPQTTWWGASIQFLGIRYSYVCGSCLIVGTVLNLNRLQFGRQILQSARMDVPHRLPDHVAFLRDRYLLER